MTIALDRKFDLDFPIRRGRGPIGVQGLPVGADDFLGPGSQIFSGVPRDQNGGEFWHVAAIAGAGPFNDQRGPRGR